MFFAVWSEISFSQLWWRARQYHPWGAYPWWAQYTNCSWMIITSWIVSTWCHLDCLLVTVFILSPKQTVIITRKDFCWWIPFLSKWLTVTVVGKKRKIKYTFYFREGFYLSTILRKDANVLQVGVKCRTLARSDIVSLHKPILWGTAFILKYCALND